MNTFYDILNKNKYMWYKVKKLNVTAVSSETDVTLDGLHFFILGTYVRGKQHDYLGLEICQGKQHDRMGK